jgi:hypothetical protein
MRLWKKGPMSLYGESQFGSQLLEFLQLINAWLVGQWDECEHE